MNQDSQPKHLAHPAAPVAPRHKHTSKDKKASNDISKRQAVNPRNPSRGDSGVS
jgi:hypothetical protein